MLKEQWTGVSNILNRVDDSDEGERMILQKLRNQELSDYARKKGKLGHEVTETM